LFSRTQGLSDHDRKTHERHTLEGVATQRAKIPWQRRGLKSGDACDLDFDERGEKEYRLISLVKSQKA
jgi:hypothetical protein